MSTSTNMDDMNCEDTTLPPSTPEGSSSTGSTKTNSSVTRVVNESAKLLNTNLVIPKDTFVTINADKGEYRSRFRILPYSRCFDPKFFGRLDNLAHCIKKGGGIVLEYGEDEVPLSHEKVRDDVIKILDLEYVRANIGTTQDMLLPYDCFSSSFVWNQVHHRTTSSNGEKRDADLNLYRVSPSSLVSYDANAIFQGFMCWNEIQPISSEKLTPAIRIKEVAMQMFPEIIFFPECESETKRTRRFYQRKEGQALLDKICKMDAHDQVFGVTLYRKLAKNCFENRSALSLKEHFKKTILPHVLKNDDHYFVEPDDQAKFQMVTQKEGRAKLKEMKKTQMKEAKNDICRE